MPVIHSENGVYHFSGGSVSYIGVSLGSITTYTTTEHFRVNGSRVFENQCEDGKWTPQAEIVHTGDSIG